MRMMSPFHSGSIRFSVHGVRFMQSQLVDTSVKHIMFPPLLSNYYPN